MVVICIGITVFILFLILTWCESSHRYTPSSEFLNRNISNEEFLAAVPSATPEKALRVREIISDQLDIPIECIHPDDRFVEDLRAD